MTNPSRPTAALLLLLLATTSAQVSNPATLGTARSALFGDGGAALTAMPSCFNTDIANKAQRFLASCAPTGTARTPARPGCNSTIVRALRQGCGRADLANTTEVGGCMAAITKIEQPWFATCMSALANPYAPKPPVEQAAFDTQCSGYKLVVGKTLERLDASGKPGLMIGFLGYSTKTALGASADLPTVFLTTVLLLQRFEGRYSSLSLLGDYGMCNSIAESDYNVATVGTAVAQVNIGLCLPRTCRASVATGMAALTNGTGGAISLVDVTKLEADATLGDDPAAVMCVMFLVAVTLVVASATLVDGYHWLQDGQGDGAAPGSVQSHGALPAHVLPRTREDDTAKERGLVYEDGEGSDDELLDGAEAAAKSGSPTPAAGTPSATAGALAGTGCQPRSLQARMLMCFSLYRNLPKLLSTKKAPGAIDCFNGMRVLSMMWVVLGHAFLIGGLLNPLNQNGFETFDLMNQPHMQWVVNAFFSVDSFFFIGGFLVCYGICTKLKGLRVTSYAGFFRRFPLLLAYGLRYLRLTPLYAVVVWISATLPPYLGSGPMYQQACGKDSEVVQTCIKGWYSNLLYFNVFVEHGSCVGQSWYMANDFIFFLLAPLFIVPMWVSFSGHAKPSAWNNTGIYWTAFVALTLSVACAAHTEDSSIPAFSLGGFINPGKYAPTGALGRADNFYNKNANSYYMMPWFRAQPYLVGVVFAFMVKTDLLPRRIPRAAVAGSLAVLAVLAYVMIWGLRGETNVYCVKNNYLGYDYTPDDCEGLSAPPSLFGDAMYNGFARGTWAAMLAVLTYICHYGHGGPINWFLGSGAWLPFARMSFAAYLIHFLQLQVYFYSKQEQVHLHVSQMFMDFISNLACTYVWAFLLCSFVEFPVGQLIKMATTPQAKRTRPGD